MKIIDFSFICMRSIHSSVITPNSPRVKEFCPDLIRYNVLDSLRKLNVDLKNRPGSFVIACDGRNSWRKKEFPFYKAHRAKERNSHIHIDWDIAFSIFDSIKQEIQTYTNWPVIEIANAEADDVIATLCMYSKVPSEITVVSPDKDFVQLLAFVPEIKIYNISTGKYRRCDDPLDFLNNMIVEGDRSDGIPNVLSDDDTFINDTKKSTKLTAKRRLEILSTKVDELPSKLFNNWNRNRKLIDFNCIPKEIRRAILSYRPQNINNKLLMYKYLSKYGMVTLLDKIHDFK